MNLDDPMGEDLIEDPKPLFPGERGLVSLSDQERHILDVCRNTELSEEEWDRLIENPPKPSPALRALFAKK